MVNGQKASEAVAGLQKWETHPSGAQGLQCAQEPEMGWVF